MAKYLLLDTAFGSFAELYMEQIFSTAIALAVLQGSADKYAMGLQLKTDQGVGIR